VSPKSSTFVYRPPHRYLWIFFRLNASSPVASPPRICARTLQTLGNGDTCPSILHTMRTEAQNEKDSQDWPRRTLNLGTSTILSRVCGSVACQSSQQVGQENAKSAAFFLANQQMSFLRHIVLLCTACGLAGLAICLDSLSPPIPRSGSATRMLGTGN
jgi:hypothetical protein